MEQLQHVQRIRARLHRRGRRLQIERRLDDLAEQGLQPVTFEEAAERDARDVGQGSQAVHRMGLDHRQPRRQVQPAIGRQSPGDRPAHRDRLGIAPRTHILQFRHQAFTTRAPLFSIADIQ